MAEDSASSHRIESWIDEVERAWTRLGVPGRERRRLSADLERDLEESVAVGADLDELLVEDTTTFARELALATEVELLATITRAPVTTWRLITTMIGGGIGGALLTWYVVFPVGLTALSEAPEIAAIVILYVAAAACVVAGALAAVRWRFRDDPASTPRRVIAAGVGFVVGGLLGIAPTVGLSAAAGYSDALTVVLLLTVVAGSFCAAGAWLALRVADHPRASAEPTSALASGS